MDIFQCSVGPQEMSELKVERKIYKTDKDASASNMSVISSQVLRDVFSHHFSPAKRILTKKPSQSHYYVPN